ncbi:ATP-binding protein [Angustibacter sp. McL0619]|uniref:ATP-binding protein n=1 Tax=Angustibacter sp. McL0619 TaxID=3415676 RepID=UPI003CEC7553
MTQVATRIPTRTRTLRVPHAYSSVPRTRRTIGEDLRGRDVPATVVDEAELVVSELLGNAVRHASALPDGTVRVHWQVKGGVVELDVTDGGGRTVPMPAQPTLYATRGRGLRIVRSLAHEWGVLDEDRGRTVWVCLGGPSRRRRP